MDQEEFSQRMSQYLNKKTEAGTKKLLTHHLDESLLMPHLADALVTKQMDGTY